MLKRIEVKTGITRITGPDYYNTFYHCWITPRKEITKTVVINTDNIYSIDCDDGVIKMNDGTEYEVDDYIDDEFLEELLG